MATKSERPDGSINTVGTDNTSPSRKTKNPGAGLHGFRPGLPVLGTHLPTILHYGRECGVPLERMIESTTRLPASAYSIYPQKGTIAVCSDAALVIVDLDLEKVVDAAELGGISDFSPLEDKHLRGWPVATVKGGEIIARDGKIVGKRKGRYLGRRPSAGSEFEWAGRINA